MTDKEWISCEEAARITNIPKENITRLIQMGAILGKDDNGVLLADKNHLIAWYKNSKKPRVEVADIFIGIRRTLLEHHKTIYAKEQAQHPGIRGTLYENLIRDFLRDQLPQRFYVSAGQVISSNPVFDENHLIKDLSNQIDIVIFDAQHQPILLPNYELFPIEGTLAVIEVKSRLDKSTLVGTKQKPGALSNIRSAKRLTSSEAQSLVHAPWNIHFENQRFDLRHIPSPLGVVFAFSSIKPDTLAEYWVNWNNNVENRHRVDIICLLDRAVLLINKKRFSRLYDTHQISTDDPLASANNNEIVCIKSPAILFFFFNLLLRELRRMSFFTQQFTATTPSSYLRNVSIERLFTMSDALDPISAEDLRYFDEIQANDDN